MAERTPPRRLPAPAKTPARRLVARIGWLLAVIAVIGIATRPSTPWLYLWVPMLTFGVAKLPSDLRDAWKRRRPAQEEAQ
jgi:hypothetical protein